MLWQKKEKNQKEEFYQNLCKDNIGGGSEELKKLLAVISYITDGLLVFDGHNKLSLINPPAEKFFEVKKEKVWGKSIFELNRFPNFIQLVSLLGGEMKNVSREDLQIRENFILEVTSIPMIINEARVGTLVVLHDVTREKLVERMKSEFVTLAAHQLRTPISALKWSLQMLLEGDLGELNEKQRKIIEKSYSANNKAINLVTDLLNLAQIEEGKYLSKVNLSSIEDVIESVVDGYSDKLKEKKIKFEFKKSEEEMPKIMIDVDRMSIAIRNLFDNAVRYTPSGGRILILIEKGKKEIGFQIKDNGLGIPENQQDKIFTRFFRGDNIKKIDTEGTGLGLYIVKNIIEAHGGRIWFESKENKGTTFHFIIPIKEKFGEFLTEEFY